MSQAVLILGLILAVIVFCYMINKQKIRTVYSPSVEKLDDPCFLISPNPKCIKKSGPYPGKPLNIPVPRGSLKESSEPYGFPFYRQYRPLRGYDYFKPYGPNQTNEIVYATTPTYDFQQTIQGKPLEMGFGVQPSGFQGLPLGYSPPYTGSGGVPFYSSVSSFSPFPEINTPWEKIGLLTTIDPQTDEILNLYRSPIAPLQDLFDYAVQDKNGFIIKLRGVRGTLEDGDIVPEVIGKESLGPWKVNNFVKDKYVWT